MSDDWVIFISADPLFVPSPQSQIAALELLRYWMPDADEIQTNVSDKVEFVHAGVNASEARCPGCGESLDLDWVYRVLGAAFPDGVGDSMGLILESPCCHASVSLNDLVWDWDQGFALYQLSAMNPNVGRIPSDQVAQLEAVLGTPLRVVYRHL